jgi:hypothetical protein
VKEDTNRKLEDNINTLNKVVDDQAKRMEAEKEGYREL